MNHRLRRIAEVTPVITITSEIIMYGSNVGSGLFMHSDESLGAMSEGKRLCKWNESLWVG